MKRLTRLLAFPMIVVAALAGTACVEDGIGMGVPSSGVRIQGSTNTPPVLVRGGPVY